ncbi:MAG: response regulator [Cyanobacteria bacterium P01_H01_bin.105]
MEITELTKLVELPSTEFEGHLILTDQNFAWSLTIVQGRLLYAVNKLHAVRCWNRNLEQYFPNHSYENKVVRPAADQPWQIQWIDQGVAQQHLSLIRTKLMIRTIIQECLFELSLCNYLQRDWQPSRLPISQISRSLTLSTWEVKMTHNKVKDMRQQWRDAGLIGFTPMLSPRLAKSVDPRRLKIPHQYLTGKHTLWDIATVLNKPAIEIAQHLLPLVDDKTLELNQIPDLPLSSVKLSTTKTSTTRSSTARTSSTAGSPRRLRSFPSSVISAKPAKPVSSLIETASPLSDNTGQPLIACIDDSPVLAHSLKKILATGGYRTLIIQEPMQGFSQLIEHVPSLILLDVMLPNADGYNICRFLRDTPVFKDTPIIILTGRSKPVDRARASMAGATEFLVKPPETKELLNMIRKHLGTREKLSD